MVFEYIWPHLLVKSHEWGFGFTCTAFGKDKPVLEEEWSLHMHTEENP